MITKTGLEVESALDTRSYKKGIKISKAEMNAPTSPAISSIRYGMTRSGRASRQNRSYTTEEAARVNGP